MFGKNVKGKENE
uniref:Uncharacterized protein n=1 Tax=Rhizophora mucronata TaxID=61149 RepID=A0A2P2QFT2_RHIMU